MITQPNCKINLGLHVVAKREDGYHNLETVFYPVALCDELEMRPSDVFGFVQEGIAIDSDPMDNLVVKAYRMLQADYPDLVGPVEIRLKKMIPFGAGLGGGSADAAFAIGMVDELFGLGLSVGQKEGYARRLGADCAFFVQNKPVYATGRGDEFSRCEVSLEGYSLVLLKPQCGVSTADAYRGLAPRAGEVDIREALRRPVSEWKDCLVNHFEESVFAKCPEIASLKDLLYQKGAIYACMSGSGSTVFGIFEKGKAPVFDSLPEGTACFVM